MKDAFGKLFRHSAVFFVGLVFQRAAKFFLLPLYWLVFPPAQFGLLDLFEVFIQLMTLVFSFALPSAYIKFRRIDVDEGVVTENLQGTILILLLWALVFLGLMMTLFQTPLSWLFFKGSHSRLYTIAAFATIANIAFLTVQCVLRAHGRAVFFVLLSSLQFALLMVANIYLIRFRGLGIEGALWSLLLAWGLPSLLFGAANAHRFKWRYDSALARQLIRFAAPLVPFSIISFFISTSGRLFLQHFWGPDEVGIFSAANRVALILMLICISPFQTAWGYLGLDFLKRDNAREIFSRAFTYLLAIGLGGYLLVLFIGQEIVFLFGKERYIPALPYVGVLAAGHLMALFFYWANPILIRRNMTLRILFLSLPSLTIAIGGGWFLIPRFGIAAASAVFAVAMVTQTVLTMVAANRLVTFRFEMQRVLKILIVFACIHLAGQRFSCEFPDWDRVIAATEFVLFPLLLVAVRFFTRGELDQISAWRRSLWGRRGGDA